MKIDYKLKVIFNISSASIMTFIFSFMLGCATVTEPPPGSNVPLTKFPAMSIGDSWVTSTTKTKTSAGGETRAKVVKVESNGAFAVDIIKGNDHLLFFYDNQYRLYKWKNLLTEKTGGPKTPAKFLNFPLFVGKTWKEDIWGKSIGGVPYEYRMIYKIERFENVSTRAGTFEAFKIKRTDSPKEVPQSLNFIYYWYSPKVKAIIKRESIKRGNMELISYSLNAKKQIEKKLKTSKNKNNLNNANNNKPKAQPANLLNSKNSTNTIKTRLLKLKDLLDSGLINKDDYNRKKEELLDEM